MNGAETLIDTLVGNGVDLCFANPGTSEMHFLAALENPRMRSVLSCSKAWPPVLPMAGTG